MGNLFGSECTVCGQLGRTLLIEAIKVEMQNVDASTSAHYVHILGAWLAFLTLRAHLKRSINCLKQPIITVCLNFEINDLNIRFSSQNKICQFFPR